MRLLKQISVCTFYILLGMAGMAQQALPVKLVKEAEAKAVDVFIGGKLFTRFIYPDTLEKPVLYPLFAANGSAITRGFPLHPVPGDPTDHPHHIGLWFNFENVNGLDFWNNSFAIPTEKKSSYGWIKTTGTPQMSNGSQGTLRYQANWDNQQNEVLLTETTEFTFSGNSSRRIVDRTTTLTANTDVLFKDAKDGLLGLRVAHALQMPSKQDQKFTDDKGNVTVVKAGTDNIPNGNYLTSEGKQGDDAWSTRGSWCKLYGKLGTDSVSIVIFDHPSNPNYPTYWHARGYGLFAANPLGENIFTNGKSTKNLQLKKGESVTFRYRILIDNSTHTPDAGELGRLAAQFGSEAVKK